MDRLTRPAQGEDQDQSVQEHFLSSLSPLPIGRAAQLSWLWLVHMPALCPTLDTSTASFSQTLSPHFPPPHHTIHILRNFNTMSCQPKWQLYRFPLISTSVEEDFPSCSEFGNININLQNWKMFISYQWTKYDKKQNSEVKCVKIPEMKRLY